MFVTFFTTRVFYRTKPVGVTMIFKMKDKLVWFFIMVVIVGLSGCGLANSVPKEPIEFVEAIESSVSQDEYKLAGLSDRYPHGALGDLFEPTQLVRINNSGEEKL